MTKKCVNMNIFLNLTSLKFYDSGEQEIDGKSKDIRENQLNRKHMMGYIFNNCKFKI